MHGCMPSASLPKPVSIFGYSKSAILWGNVFKQEKKTSDMVALQKYFGRHLRIISSGTTYLA